MKITKDLNLSKSHYRYFCDKKMIVLFLPIIGCSILLEHNQEGDECIKKQ